MSVQNDGITPIDQPSGDRPVKGADGIIRILIVDDEREFAQSISERLRNRGYHTEVTFDGKHALESIGRNRHDIVLLDLNMPGMHGMEVLRFIRKSNTRIHVIIITGYISDLVSSAAVMCGAFEILVKPIDFNALIDAIQRAVPAETQLK
jgi:CheY-like chemotaxis protein